MVHAQQLVLSDLWHDVVRARAAMTAERRTQPTGRTHGGGARHHLVLALEAYTSGLERTGRPVPYALRDELRLQRSVDDLD